MISIDEMRSTLLTVEQVQETLAQTEPLSEYPLEEGNVSFVLEDGWNHALDNVEGNDSVNASIVLGGHEIQLTKDALLQASSLCGIPTAYIKRTPAKLVEPHLNYWYGEQGLGNRPAKLLVTKDKGAAVTRQSIKPFSNLRILGSVLEGLHDNYGTEEVLVDAKFSHSLAETHVRLVLPNKKFTVRGTGLEGEDEWFLGLSLFNSLTGKTRTSIDGYLFRWWCKNGAIDTHASSGVWSRSSNDSASAEVYAWARETVPNVLSELETSKQSLEFMASDSIGDNVNQILEDLFDDYGLPARDRKTIIESMVEDDELTMYSLMQAVTSAANDLDIKPMEQRKLMSVGAELTHVGYHRCEVCNRVNK